MQQNEKEIVWKYESDTEFCSQVVNSVESVLDALLECEPVQQDGTRYMGSRDAVIKAVSALKFLGIKQRFAGHVTPEFPLAVYGNKYYTNSMRFMFLLGLSVTKYKDAYCVHLQVYNHCSQFFEDAFFGNEEINWADITPVHKF
jgi:hypothetical protein